MAQSADRGFILLQGLQNKLKAWAGFILRSAYAKEVTFEQGASGEFTLVVRWEKDGAAGEYKKLFSRPFVFGRTYSYGPSAWTVDKCAGDYARQVLREVLAQRGVL